MTPNTAPMECSRQRAMAVRLGLVVVLVGMPGALGRGLRHRHQMPAAFAEANGLRQPELESIGTMDMLARATSENEKQTAAITATKPAKSAPLVSTVVCDKAAQQLEAMSCSLVTQISGYPEGCECRMKAKECPAVRHDLGFTGVSPSVPFSPPQLGGQTVIQCMYWQWLPSQDRSKETAQAAKETKEMAVSLVKAAHIQAQQSAQLVATSYYSMTPAPFLVASTFSIPATPAPIMEPIRFVGTPPS